MGVTSDAAPSPPPGSPPRAEKRERTRRALAEAALEVALREGRAHATVEAISARAGVSVRTFHNHFASKDAALAHLLRPVVSSLEARLRAQPADATTFEALRAAWLAEFEAEEHTIARVAVALSDGGASASGPSRSDAATRRLHGAARELAEPVLDELARRHRRLHPFAGHRSRLAAAFALRIVLDTTLVALSPDPAAPPLLGMPGSPSYPDAASAEVAEQGRTGGSGQAIHDLRNALDAVGSLLEPGV